MTIRTWSTILCLILLAGPARSQSTRASPQSELDQVVRSELSRRSELAIKRGVRFLLDCQNEDGSWKGNGAPADTESGCTALVALALLSCGEPHYSPALDRAIKYLKKAQPQKSHYGTYSVALRACVYAQLPESLRRTELRADLRWLQDSLLDSGMYTYADYRSSYGDYSNSQYGVLGVWYAQLAGLDVPRTYWKKVEEGWLVGQYDDGGWGYVPPGSRRRSSRGPRASLTAAGAATLYITNDYLHARDAEDLNKITVNEPLERAIKWLGDNFAVEQNAGRDTPLGPQLRPDKDTLDILGGSEIAGTDIAYMLFGFERVGEASGLTRFGANKWFDEGADYLTRIQSSEGNWKWRISYGTEIDTAYALLFLSRGRAPVVIQKLQFDGRWNNRSRDVSLFTHFMRRAGERHVNWQVVSVDATPAELRESPLLYVASDYALGLTSDQKRRLKDYVLQGGLIVGVNEGKFSQFARSFEALGKELFPQYSFRELSREHPVYTANFPVSFPATPIRGLGNELRELMVLFPDSDMSWKWQSTVGGFQPRNTPFASLANLQLYVTDWANPRYKGEDTWIARNPEITPIRSVRVGRLQHGGNWDPEPGGWERLSNHMWNVDRVEVKVEPTLTLVPASAPSTVPAPTTRRSRPAANRYALAHLATTRSLVLSAPQKTLLRAYVSTGGLLLLEAAGGSPEAAGSFDLVLRDLYPNVSITALPLDDPIYRGASYGGRDIQHVKYRRSADFQSTHVPRLKRATVDGRLIAIISQEDLSGALVGYATTGPIGYSPASATDIIRNLVLWRASR
jgi:hypothetical protein